MNHGSNTGCVLSGHTACFFGVLRDKMPPERASAGANAILFGLPGANESAACRGNVHITIAPIMIRSTFILYIPSCDDRTVAESCCV